MKWLLLAALATVALAQQQQPVVLVVSADMENTLLSAGGAIAAMADKGSAVYIVRVTNDEKDSWNLPPEETALRNRQESEAAARILGVKEVISLGYRAAEMADVPFTTVRDRLLFYIRHYRPAVLFVPNPYTEYDRVLDRYHVGRAAEDAWRAASMENYLPPFQAMGLLRPHVTGEVYYYAPPVDPRRKEAETTATFAPQPKVVDIAATIAKKVKAAQAMKTINQAMAMRLKARLEASGRRLPLLDTVTPAAIDKLVEENVRGLARVASAGSSYALAEEFQHAGLAYRIPAKYRK
jgi:LmbE family N-acetylglucosaminyl deacetylase